MYKNEVAKDTILSKVNTLIKGTSRDYYLSIYILKKYNEELLIFNLLGDSEDMIYDITFMTNNLEPEKKFVTFLEMCQTARLRDFRFLDPFDQITEIEILN